MKCETDSLASVTFKYLKIKITLENAEKTTMYNDIFMYFYTYKLRSLLNVKY